MHVSQVRMSIPEWIAIPDNPAQRDTKRHAKKAMTRHLKKASPAHARVAAAFLQDEKIFKLDGHTRAYLWAEGCLEQPPFVRCDMYHVDSMEEVVELYKHFDAATAAESAMDKLHGAYRLHDFAPESLVVLYGGVTSAIALIEGLNGSSFNVYEGITPWISTLRRIDKEHLSQQRITTALLAAALITVRIYGEKAMPFWKAYCLDEGKKDGPKKDGVQALSELIALRRASKTLSGHGNIMDICRKALSCFETYRRGDTYTYGVKASSLDEYRAKIAKMQESKSGNDPKQMILKPFSKRIA